MNASYHFSSRATCRRRLESLSLPLRLRVQARRGGRERTMCNKTIQYPSARPPPALTALPPRSRFYPATLLTPALSFVMYKPGRILINSPCSKYRISIRDTDFFLFFPFFLSQWKKIIKISTMIYNHNAPVKFSFRFFFQKVLISNKRDRASFNFNLNLLNASSFLMRQLF